VMIHAMVGGLLAEASGGDFKTGALAAGANEALVDQLDTWVGGDKFLLDMTSQLVGLLAASTLDGADAQSLQTGAWVAQNATQYNYTLHEEKAQAAIEEAQQRCEFDLVCPNQGKSVDQQQVLDALRALAAKDEKAVQSLDKDTLAFAYYTLRRDPNVRSEIFLPDTPLEHGLDWGQVVIDLGYPTPTGKVGGAVKVTEKVSAEVIEALGKKFGDDLASFGGKGVGNGSKFADQAKLYDHFARHGSDFGAKNALDYQAQADRFLTVSKPVGVLEKVRPNGDIVRYNPVTDEFGVMSRGGSIRTYYKPDPAVHGKGSNLDYFNAQ